MTTPAKRALPFLPMGGLYEADDVAAALKVIEAATAADGNFFPLPEENEFQDRLAAHEGAKKAIAVNSCGTALDCCLMALGIKPGDEVLTTPLTFVCTAGTAIGQGAQVVFADIDPLTWCLDPAAVRARITPRTRAIIPVHFTGLACDIDGFDRITAETGVPVIYDAAHAVGTRYQGRPIGGRGQASCYSFQSNKNMTCLGEGGAVTTDDEAFAEIVRQKKTFGYVYGPQLRVASIGFNYRMTKPQYAVGITQLGKIDRVIARRQAAMVRMNELLAGVDEIIRPAGHGPGHGSHLYVVRLDTDRVQLTREALMARLKTEYGVGTAIHYTAVWTWDAFAQLGYSEEKADCPIAAKICRQVISLPIFPRTTEEDLQYLAWAVNEAIHDLG
ncbi:aminotransferase class I/II-fold pyridoxal phosphate-dependent enzyme [bacterium]|nr:aminotransferase class I/II-fold pyridoxal phosphate-dependent enzyme [bacterium]